MPSREIVTNLRVRYSETDQMGTFYNSRALEWFECGRTAMLREIGTPYAEMEDLAESFRHMSAEVREREAPLRDEED